MRKVIITAAPNMDSESLAALEAGIYECFGSDVQIQKTVDESLVGGFSVKADGTVYDYSVQTKLKKLKNYFRE